MSAIRLGKGNLTTSFEQLYIVPADRLVALKSVVISNSTEADQVIDLKLAGIEAISVTVKAGEFYQVSALDQIIMAEETIEGKASSTEGVSYYISGKLLLPQDISSETQWMQEQWEAWWAAHPEAYEGDWHDWMAAKTDEPGGAFYAEWKAWFDELQDTTNLVTKSQFDAHLAEFVRLKLNDIRARGEILGIKLKLSEADVLEFLNKTGIGFYDLFENLDYVDTENTTAAVDVVENEVCFKGEKTLIMRQQKFDSFNELKLAIYDKERTIINTIESSNDNEITVLIPPGSIEVGEKFHFDGQIYVVSVVAQAQ